MTIVEHHRVKYRLMCVVRVSASLVKTLMLSRVYPSCGVLSYLSAILVFLLSPTSLLLQRMSLWQLLKGTGGRYTPGAVEYGCGETPEDAIGPLDPIDPKIAGKADLQRMKVRMKPFAFAVRALLLITSLTHFLSEVKPPYITRRVPTSEKWWTIPNHLKQLRDYQMIDKLDDALVWGCSSYFAVGKSDGSARSIWNGKRFSLLCAVPPPCGLPDIILLLRALEELFRDCQSPTVMEGDVRHYFHQLPLEFDISRFMCVYMDRTFWRWKNLPMGFSWSPFIAQCVGMGAILATLEDCGVDVSSYKDLKVPPSLIIIRDANNKISLIAALWYDNIFIGTRDPSLAPKIFSKLRKNYEGTGKIDKKSGKPDEGFHLMLKEWNLHGPQALRNGYPQPNDADGKEVEPKYASYLGLEFKMIRVRYGNDDRDHNQLHWRVASKRLSEWSDLSGLLNARMSCRTVSRCCGAILWRHHVALTPLCRLESIIERVRRCGLLCPTRSSWDISHQWSITETSSLQQGLAVATTQEWWTEPVRDTDDEIIIATDSSKRRWGIITWNQQRQIIDFQEPISGFWNSDMLPSIIFVKELTAAVMAIERACRSRRGCKVHLFCDNTAAVAVLRRLASSSHAGNELARRADTALTSAGCILEVHYIHTKQNPSDDPSRGKALVPSKIDFMWNLLEASKRGGHIDPSASELRRKAPTTEKSLRHAEEGVLADDDVSDSESEEDDHEEFGCLNIADEDD